MPRVRHFPLPLGSPAFSQVLRLETQGPQGKEARHPPGAAAPRPSPAQDFADTAVADPQLPGYVAGPHTLVG